MINSVNKQLQFGQYRGLTVKEIYQGTLNIDRVLLRGYLDYILNKTGLDSREYFPELELIERFDVTENTITVVGEIYDPQQPHTYENRTILGNNEKVISTFINQHSNDNFLGVLEGLRTYNKLLNKPCPIGGDPEYLEWCERNVQGFQLSTNCRKELEKLSIARFVGFQLFYIGSETYEYAPKFSVE